MKGENMRLPNGYGSVVKLKGKRRRPYWVRLTTGWTEKGYPKYKTLGYSKTRAEGLELLAKFHSGQISENEVENPTLKELFEKWSKERLPQLNKANMVHLKSMYRFIQQYDYYKYKNIRAYEMQNTIADCSLGYSTQSGIKALWKHLDRFAFEQNIIDKMYSGLIVTAKARPKERHPFTETEIQKIWQDYRDGYEDAEMILIFLYTGFRITELRTMKLENIDLTEWTMKGGIKTDAGRNRIVPIHSAIRGFVRRRAKKNRACLFESNGHEIDASTFTRMFKNIMVHEHMNHTPHECRHTFESMLDDAGANRKCIDLMMGHTSKDIGNRVYNHKTLDQLRENIELLKTY